MASYRDASGCLCLGGVSLPSVVESVPTPAYVYDVRGVVDAYDALDRSFDEAPHAIEYAVKANSAGTVVRALAERGAGADVVSGAELLLALRAGVAPERIVFSGVAKATEELDLAILTGPHGIGAVQVESIEEIPRIAARARHLGRTANVAIRINPGVAAEEIDTHRHITTGHDEAKFGVPVADLAFAQGELEKAPELQLVGVGAHVGSQLTATDGYVQTARVVFDVAGTLRTRNASLRFVDLGGGFGIDYGEGCPVSPADFIRAVRRLQRTSPAAGLALYCEPGRSLVGAHGVLVARVIGTKRERTRAASAPGAALSVPASVPGADARRRWLLIDAGMNDLLRPALYGARHRIVPLCHAPPSAATPLVRQRVVGPVCESSDDFGEHDLPDDAPTHVAILDAGAYGYTMSSRYNGRALPSEVFVRDGRIVHVVERAPVTDWVEERLRA